MKTVITIAVCIIALCFCSEVYKSFKDKEPTPIYYQQSHLHTTQTVVVDRKPTIGECIVAPLDFVVGVVGGTIKGIAYGFAYVAETCTPSRLYPQDEWVLLKRKDTDCCCD